MQERIRPITLNAGKVRVVLGDPDTPGLVLLTIALYEFGDAVFGSLEDGVDPMDPAEMWAGLNEIYGTWITEEGENKLNALITGMTNGAFWRDEEVFMAVCTALFDGDLGDMITAGMEELSATELMWSILEMELAWDSDEIPEFSLNIRNYIENALRREQEDQIENSKEVERAYLMMLRQLQDIGVPAAMIRTWDEEYSEVMEELESGYID